MGNYIALFMIGNQNQLSYMRSPVMTLWFKECYFECWIYILSGKI